MNVFDRALRAVSPQAALKREAAKMRLAQVDQVNRVLNTGYSAGGASHIKKSMRGMTDYSASPQLDIDANLRTLVSRSRVLYMTSPIAASAIKTTKTNVIGSGLRLKSRIDADVLGLTEDQADEWEGKIEREFALWADTRQCDALRLNNFYEMQGLVFVGQLLNGDGFCLKKFESPTPYMPYGLRLQIVEADRVCTPYSFSLPMGNAYQPFWGVNPDNGNQIYSGVEVDKSGATVAYHICNQYPYAMTGYNFTAPEWTRVPAFGENTGLPNVLHIFDAERAEQRRGVPMLAPVVEELQQLKRYEQAELMAAVISSAFTVFVTSNGPSNDMPIGESIPDGAAPVSENEAEYQMGNGLVTTLQPGEDVKFANPTRPNSAFDGFIDAMSRSIGAALEIPSELLLKKFSSNYSASRAALLEAWKMFRARREWISGEFCQPVYEQFLTEAVARGRIKAPGFFEDPIIRKAWCGSDWNGPAPGMIDPTKEVDAAETRVNNGFSTREEETIGLTGGNFKRNVRQLRKENELLAQARESVQGAE